MASGSMLPMRIVVCVKEVLDPDAVGAYALSGGLVVGEDGKTLTQTTIPRLMNAYDEQAIEAALRIREGGTECTVSVVSVGDDLTTLLRHAVALGVDDVHEIRPPEDEPDCHVIASLLGAWIRTSGGADLVLCGRQASDDDQGVVPALLGEMLGMPVVAVARAVEITERASVMVTTVTPDGDETAEAALPAVVTISNELGEPRYPTMPMRMAARRVNPEVVEPDSISEGADLAPRVRLVRQYVPTVKGECVLIEGDGPAAQATRLVEALVGDRVLQGRP
ncbi:MAG: electron transfer flavoprotein subunit beta/FixA family protein [Actinobacteria bacterium ATB1]|nr:electron transfer flavoprotein subunit beta/FixA family protein [Actinobacteria bacterium ATB1]